MDLRPQRQVPPSPRRPRPGHGAGEVAESDTHVPHWLGPDNDQPVELLVIFGKQGERAHLRARPTS